MCPTQRSSARNSYSKYILSSAISVFVHFWPSTNTVVNNDQNKNPEWGRHRHRGRGKCGLFLAGGRWLEEGWKTRQSLENTQKSYGWKRLTSEKAKVGNEEWGQTRDRWRPEDMERPHCFPGLEGLPGSEALMWLWERLARRSQIISYDSRNISENASLDKISRSSIKMY